MALFDEIRPGTQLLFTSFSNGDFLEFGGLLAADAIAWLDRLEVADLAEVADAIKFAVAKRIKPLDFEGAVRLPRSFHSNFPIGQALVLERAQQVGRDSGERLIFLGRP